MNIKNLLQSRITTKWWLEKDIPKDDLDYILECARLAPSNNGKFTSSIVVCKDPAYKKWLYENNTYCFGTPNQGGYRRGIPHPTKYDPIQKRYNGQVNGSVVLTWIITGNRNPEKSDHQVHYEHTISDVYISAAYASIAAAEKNIDTGFCACIGGEEISEYLNIGSKAILVMGLGYKQEWSGVVRKQVFIDGKHVGWDIDNIPPKKTDTPGRKYKPSIEDYVIWK